MNVTKHEVVNAMLKYGGSFIKGVAGAWLLSEPAARMRIEDKYSYDWKQYVEMAKRLKEAKRDR
jgi:hypothetical protein